MMRPFALVCAFVTASALAAAAAAPVTAPADQVDDLLRQLDDEDFDVRQNADKQLRARGKALLPRLLSEQVTNPSPEVRYRLDRMVSSYSNVERLSGWARLLDHDDARCRDEADQRLRQACPAALPALLKLKHGLDARCKARLDRFIEELADASF